MRRTAPLILLAALAGCADEGILHGLEEPQANEVLVALADRGVTARKVREDGPDGRWRVDVAPAEAGHAQRVLAERALPRTRAPGFSDVFGSGSMVPTPTEEHARWMHALSGELARSVEAIDGVAEARVHLALPRPDPFRPGGAAPARAAVLVKCRPAACAGVRALEGGIRALVAGAADGLEPAGVSVVIAQAAETASAAPGPRRRALPAVLLGFAGTAALAAVAVGSPAIRARLRRRRA